MFMLQYVCRPSTRNIPGSHSYTGFASNKLTIYIKAALYTQTKYTPSAVSCDPDPQMLADTSTEQNTQKTKSRGSWTEKRSFHLLRRNWSTSINLTGTYDPVKITKISPKGLQMTM